MRVPSHHIAKRRFYINTPVLYSSEDYQFSNPENSSEHTEQGTPMEMSQSQEDGTSNQKPSVIIEQDNNVTESTNAWGSVVACLVVVNDIQSIMGYIFIDFQQTLTKGMLG